MTHKLRAVERVNLHLVLDEWFKAQQPRAQLVDTRPNIARPTAVGMVARGRAAVAPVEFATLSATWERPRMSFSAAFYLMHLADQRSRLPPRTGGST